MTDTDDRAAVRERSPEQSCERSEHSSDDRSSVEQASTGDERAGAESEAGAAAEPIAITDDDQFDGLVDAHDVVLVDFHADWCGPCEALKPAVESVAANTSAVVATVDVDALDALADRHGVRTLPTLVLYADGDRVEQLVGSQNESRLRRLVERYA